MSNIKLADLKIGDIVVFNSRDIRKTDYDNRKFCEVFCMVCITSKIKNDDGGDFLSIKTLFARNESTRLKTLFQKSLICDYGKII